jgi:hypothetical protein
MATEKRLTNSEIMRMELWSPVRLVFFPDSLLRKGAGI